MDAGATAIICLQETKLSTITAPTGYQVTHVARKSRAGGGIATLVPHSMHVLATNTHEYYVHVQLAVSTGVLHVINVYIPPRCNKPDHLVWGYLLQLLDSIPVNEPVVLVGDFNAHLGSSSAPCPLHGETRAPLLGGTCGRGRLLQVTLDARDMHVLNGCAHVQPYTCTTLQRGGTVVRSTVDYLIVNSAALSYVHSIAIQDHPPRRTSKNYHAHLVM